jgi:hypothetical protein
LIVGCPAVGLQNTPPSRANSSHSKIILNKPSVWANDIDELEITLELKDANGAPFKVSSVNLAFSSGGNEVFRVPARRDDVVFTDANGRITLKTRFDKPGDYTVQSLVVGDPCFTDEYPVNTASVRVRFPPKVESFEVIQAIRLPPADQTRFLVQNKDTVIRIIVRNQDRDPAEIAARLEISSGSHDTTLFPKGSAKMILQMGVPPNLANLNSTFNFLVPAASIGPRLSFRALLDPPSKLDDIMPTEDLAFQNRTLNIKYVVFNVNGNPPNQGILSSASDLLLKLYPIARLQYAPLDSTIRPMTTAEFRNGDGVNPALATILSQTSKNQHPDILFGWVATGGCQGSGYFKPVPVTPENPTPRIDGLKAPVAYGPSTAGCSKKVLAHEVAHDFLFGHPVPPFYQGLRVGPGTIEDLGIEIVSGSLRPRVNDLDLMNQNLSDTTVWVSRFLWTNLFQSLPGSQAAGTRVRSQSLGPQPLLLIRGTIDNLGNAALDPILPALTSLRPATGGPHCLRLEDSSGQALLTHCFSLDGLGPDLEYHATGRFVETVTRPPGLAKIVWLRDGQVLANRQVSANPPSVVITSPTPGQTWDGIRTVQWVGQDLDGDILTYLIQYSPDDRQSWVLLEADLSRTHYDLNANDVPGGERFWFRVVATDGMHTTSAEVGPILMPKKAPRISIDLPLEASTFPTDSPLDFEASGYDLEDGALQDSAFTWSSDRSGSLGAGARLQVPRLPAGTHRVTLAARDTDGQSAQATVTIHIGDTGANSEVRASLVSQSVRVQRATALVLGQTYTLDLTSLSESSPPNGELSPSFLPFDVSHFSTFLLADPSLTEPLLGDVYLDVPIGQDGDANGMADFYETALALPLTTTTGDYSTEFDLGTVQAQWQRPAGSKTGTCRLVLISDELGPLPEFNTTFDLLEYKGSVRYAWASNLVHATLDLGRTQSESNTLSGPIVFKNSPTNSLNALHFDPGTFSDQNARPFAYFGGVLDRVLTTRSNYVAFLTVEDGDPSSGDGDYFDWFLFLSDPNDSDGDGIPDLTDPTGGNVGPAPAFTRIRLDGSGNLILEWSGEGRLQFATQISGPWSGLSNARSPIQFPVSAGQGYYRLIK